MAGWGLAWMITRVEGAMYIKPTVKFLGDNFFFFFFFFFFFGNFKTEVIMVVSDKAVHKAFRIHKTLAINKSYLRFFFLHYLPKLYFGFNPRRKWSSVVVDHVQNGTNSLQKFFRSWDICVSCSFMGQLCLQEVICSDDYLPKTILWNFKRHILVAFQKIHVQVQNVCLFLHTQ